MNEPGGSTGGMRPWHFYAGALAVAAAWIIFQLGWTTAQVFGASRFILGDQGSYLYAIGRWTAGEALYRDFAWQYGPLALGYYRAFAAIGGNTPLTLVVASSVAFAGAWLMLSRLVVRVAGWRWGGALALAGLLPVMSPSGIYAKNGLHGAIEMLLLAGGAVTLASARRERARAWQLGVLAGLLHWVRFGPQAGCLASALILVAWQAWREGVRGRELWQRLAGFGGRLLAGYALVALPLVAWFYAALPARGAWEQVWPAHMTAVYAASFPNRWPQISSFAEFLVQWLPALVGIGLVLVRLGRGLGRGVAAPVANDSGAATGLMFLTLNYALGCLMLFHNDHTIEGHLWLAWPGLALIALVGSRWLRVGLGVVLLPAVFNGVANHWELVRQEPALRARALALPNGQELWFTPQEARQYGELQKALGPQPQTHRLAVMLAGGGIHHFFGTSRAGRHWWFLPGMVRPWEEETAGPALWQHDLILLVHRTHEGSTSPDAGRGSGLRLPLPPAMIRQLAPHLANPRWLPGIGVLLEVKP